MRRWLVMIVNWVWLEGKAFGSEAFIDWKKNKRCRIQKKWVSWLNVTSRSEVTLFDGLSDVTWQKKRLKNSKSGLKLIKHMIDLLWKQQPVVPAKLLETPLKTSFYLLTLHFDPKHSHPWKFNCQYNLSFLSPNLSQTLNISNWLKSIPRQYIDKVSR